MGPDCHQMSSVGWFPGNRAWVENFRAWDGKADLANLLLAEKGRMALKIGMVSWGSTVPGALSNTLPLLRTAACALASHGPCRSFAKTRRARIPLLPDWQDSAWITWAHLTESRLGSRCLETAMSSDSDVRNVWFLAEKAHRFSKPRCGVSRLFIVLPQLLAGLGRVASPPQGPPSQFGFQD